MENVTGISRAGVSFSVVVSGTTLIMPTQSITIPADPESSLHVVPVQGDQRTVFRGVDWHTYHSLSEAIGEGQHVRLAYDGKDLEIIMVTSNIHENLQGIAQQDRECRDVVARHRLRELR